MNKISQIVETFIKAFKEFQERTEAELKLQLKFDEYVNTNYINWTIPKEMCHGFIAHLCYRCTQTQALYKGNNP